MYGRKLGKTLIGIADKRAMNLAASYWALNALERNQWLAERCQPVSESRVQEFVIRSLGQDRSGDSVFEPSMGEFRWVRGSIGAQRSCSRDVGTVGKSVIVISGVVIGLMLRVNVTSVDCGSHASRVVGLRECR